MAWCTIESDPGVFTELIQSGFGVTDIAAEEIYSLDSLLSEGESSFIPHTLASYGLIFLFKYTEDVDSRPTVHPSDLPDMFFARQIVTNACATQAILSVLLNAADKIQLSDMLLNLRDFTMMIDAESKGLAIGNSEEIRIAHNSFARPEPIIAQDKSSRLNKNSLEDAYHFIAYIPFQDHVYE